MHTKKGNKKGPARGGPLFFVARMKLDPSLALDEIGERRDLEELALIGEVCPVEENQPEHRRAESADHGNPENDGDDPEDYVRGQRLDGVVLDEWTLLLVFHEKHDKGDEANRVAKGSPEFVIACGIG